MKCPRCNSQIRKNMCGDLECIICGWFDEITPPTPGKYGRGVSTLVIPSMDRPERDINFLE